MADEPDEVTAEQFEAMIGARIGKLTGLGHEVNFELGDLVKDLLRGAAVCPGFRSFAVDVGTRALMTAAEITALVTKLAEFIQRRAEADRDDLGPGRPA